MLFSIPFTISDEKLHVSDRRGRDAGKPPFKGGWLADAPFFPRQSAETDRQTDRVIMRQRQCEADYREIGKRDKEGEFRRLMMPICTTVFRI